MNRFTEQTPTISSVEEIKEEPAHWHTMAMTTSEIAENDGESADGAFKHILTLLKDLSNSPIQRAECLASVWLHLHTLVRRSFANLDKLLSHIVKTTLESMLMGQWEQQAAQQIGPIKEQILRLVPHLANFRHIQYRCEYIAENIDRPWAQPQLVCIFECRDCDQVHGLDWIPASDEVEFFTKERGCLIAMRAQKLVESKLNMLAMKLTRHALRSIYACTRSHTLHSNMSARQQQCIMEIYFTLLFKAEMKTMLNSELIALELTEAMKFVENAFRTINESMRKMPSAGDNNKQSDKKRSWLDRIKKPYTYMSQFALRFILRRILNEERPPADGDTMLYSLLDIWIAENRNETDFEARFRDLVQMKSRSNPRTYAACEYVYEKFPDNGEAALKTFFAELNKELNELASHNDDYNIEATSIMEKEKDISKRYIFLSGVVKADPGLERECILTAFSLNPTEENFDLVRHLNEHRDRHINEHNQPKVMAWHRHLSDSTISDLTNFIMGPRFKKLSWDLPWPQLQLECATLVRTEKKRQIVEHGTASANEKLKFVHLNYDDFKDMMPQELPGIQKGYEIYVPDSDHGEAAAGKGDSDDTLSAPESKEWIRKEHKRRQNKRRLLKKRGQKLMEMSGEGKPDATGVNEKKRRRVRASGDSVKPARPSKAKESKPVPPPAEELPQIICDIKEEILDSCTLNATDGAYDDYDTGLDPDPDPCIDTPHATPTPHTTETPTIKQEHVLTAVEPAVVIEVASEPMRHTNDSAQPYGNACQLQQQPYVPETRLDNGIAHPHPLTIAHTIKLEPMDSASPVHSMASPTSLSPAISQIPAAKAKNPLLLYRKPKKNNIHTAPTDQGNPVQTELQLTSNELKATTPCTIADDEMGPRILTRHCTVRLTRIEHESVRQNDNIECNSSEGSLCGSEPNHEPDDAISNNQEGHQFDMDADSNGKTLDAGCELSLDESQDDHTNESMDDDEEEEQKRKRDTSYVLYTLQNTQNNRNKRDDDDDCNSGSDDHRNRCDHSSLELRQECEQTQQGQQRQQQQNQQRQQQQQQQQHQAAHLDKQTLRLISALMMLTVRPIECHKIIHFF